MPAPAPQPSITPIPVPAGTGEVLLVGGVFDPPHRAHIALPAAARDVAMPEAWLVYAPAARSPFKPAGAVASDADRLEMLRLGLEDTPRAAVWTDELDRARGDPSYWIDTLHRARRVLGPRVALRFFLGADQAAEFYRWRDPRGILALAEPLVLPRAPLESPGAILDRLRAAAFWTDGELARWRSWVLAGAAMDDSASAVRAALATGDRPVLERMLHPAVLSYIESRRLYGT